MGENIKKTLLIGAGGHSLSILEMMDEFSFFEGYVDNKEKSDMPINYLGNDEFVLNKYLPSEYDIVIGIVYVNKVNMFLRENILKRYSQYEGKSFKAKSSLVTKSSKIGKGTILFEKSFVNRSTLGKHCVVNSSAIIEHDCKIGNNVFIGPGAVISGGVTIGNNEFGGGMILFIYGDYAHYHLSARKREFSKFAVNNHFLDNAIKVAKEQGCKTFHFGGGLSSDINDSLLSFKGYFSKQRSMFYFGKKVHNKKIYNQVVEQWKEKYPDSYEKNSIKLLGYREI